MSAAMLVRCVYAVTTIPGVHSGGNTQMVIKCNPKMGYRKSQKNLRIEKEKTRRNYMLLIRNIIFTIIVGIIAVGTTGFITQARASDRINFAKGMHAYNNHDYITAAELFKKACDSGYAAGCNNLGVLYESGQGVSRNYSMAVKLFEKACEKSVNNGVCYKFVGLFNIMYTTNIGTKQDYSFDAKIFKEYCNSNNNEKIAIGCNNLGLLYINGEGVKRNYAIAGRLFRKACNSGNDDACFNIIMSSGDFDIFELSGLNTPQDFNESYRYLKNLKSIYEDKTSIKNFNYTKKYLLKILCAKHPWVCR